MSENQNKCNYGASEVNTEILAPSFHEIIDKSIFEDEETLEKLKTTSQESKG